MKPFQKAQSSLSSISFLVESEGVLSGTASFVRSLQAVITVYISDLYSCPTGSNPVVFYLSNKGLPIAMVGYQ